MNLFTPCSLIAIKMIAKKQTLNVAHLQVGLQRFSYGLSLLKCCVLLGLPDKYEIVKTLQVTGAAPSYSTSYYNYVLTPSEEIILEPGQFLGFGGAQVGFRAASNAESVDRLVSNGASSGGSHFLRFTGIKPEFLWTEHTCETANTLVTATLSDASPNSVTNETQCQDPIMDMVVEMTPTETVKKSEWLPDFYVKADEPVEISITTSKGLPILYNISSNSDVLISDSVVAEDPARSITYSTAWPTEGEYNVSLTLENLHSEEEFGSVKYVHNHSQIIHVQYPVLNDFSDEDMVEHWLIDEEVDFLLLLPGGSTPPSTPYYNCSWDDEVTDLNVKFDLAANFEENGDFLYHIKHKYASAGIYNTSCTLFNMVSFKEFSKAVMISESRTNLKSFLYS